MYQGADPFGYGVLRDLRVFVEVKNDVRYQSAPE